MIQSKKIGVITVIAVCFALIASIVLFLVGNSKGEALITSEDITTGKTTTTSEAEYTEKIFGTDIISIEILADETQWQEMLDNAASEQYIMVDVIVNGTKFESVGIRPKGNSSLTQVVDSESDRYSFRLQFDEYIKDQTCFGLKSFVVNNMQGDNSYMKEYISYELMKEAGVNCPYFGYADIKLNGANWGLYLAVELYNDSYEERIYGTTTGMLYNVKTMEIGNEPENGQTMKPNEKPEDGQTMEPNEKPEDEQAMEFNTERMGKGDRKMGGSGGSLEYTDDNSSSYSSIFENAVGKSEEEDYQRVITALKALSEGEDLEKYFDIDKILRYLAAHTIVVNLDSYSSSMAQNYYIYEQEGKITILPWDYNLSWGGFQSGSASSVVNFPIDTPVSGVEMSTRPLLEKLFEEEEYLEKYHSYLQQLLDVYFVDGKFEEKIQQLNALIEGYVEKDETAFCTVEEYKTAVTALTTLGKLRAESVQGQLDGIIPSTTAEQTANSEALIEADALNLNNLGSSMSGRGKNKKRYGV